MAYQALIEYVQRYEGDGYVYVMNSMPMIVGKIMEKSIIKPYAGVEIYEKEYATYCCMNLEVVDIISFENVFDKPDTTEYLNKIKKIGDIMEESIIVCYSFEKCYNTRGLNLNISLPRHIHGFKPYSSYCSFMEKYFKNRDDGCIRMWHPNGRLKYKVDFANNMINGKYLEYDHKGNKIKRVDIVNGKPKGKFRLWEHNIRIFDGIVDNRDFTEIIIDKISGNR